MRVRVSDVASAQSGLVLSRKETSTQAGTPIKYRRLNLRALEENGFINVSELEMFYSREPLETSLLTKPKDIVLRLFTPMHPVLIDSQNEGLLVPSQLAIFRVIDESILMPAFLRLCLAQNDLQERVKKLEYGTAQRTVKLRTVLDETIDIPDMKTQEKVVNLDLTNRNRERKYRELVRQERLLTERIIAKLLGGQGQ